MKNQKTWKKQLIQSWNPISTCKICFKPIRNTSPFTLINRDCAICDQCSELFVPKFIDFKVGDVSCLSIFNYDETIKAKLFQLKGCFDFELKDVFLEKYIRELRLKYFGYSIIYIPSFEDDDKKRGFNHVREIFKKLKLKEDAKLVKSEKIKQASSKSFQRKEIQKVLKIENGNLIRNKKVLIVDDVYTTGSTIKAAINLIKKFNPKKIKVLVMSKTEFVEK